MSSLPVAVDRTLQAMFGVHDVYTREQIRHALNAVNKARFMCARTTEVTAGLHGHISREHYRRMSTGHVNLTHIVDEDGFMAGRAASMPSLSS